MDTKKLCQKILDLAIRGKLVPQDPNDEPASVLLERIRAEKERLIKEGKIKRSKKTAADMPNNEDEMFEVPKRWCWCYIDDLCDVVRGGSPRPAGSKEFYDGDIPFLKVADLTSDNFMYVTYAQNSIKEAGLVKTRQIEVNTLLLTNSGATLGVPKINTFPATINDGIAAFLYLPQELQYYMYWFLKANTGRFRGFNQGAAQPNLNTDIIKNVRVPLPPVNEQKRIVNEIDRWYAELEVMESNEGDLLKAINLAKSKILDLAIHGKLVPQDPNDEPAIDLLKRINPKFEPCDNESEANNLPDSWRWTTIGSIFSHNTGKALNKSDSQEGSLLPYITTSNVYWNRFELSEIKKMYFKDSEIDKCTVTRGDLLVCEGGDIGRSAIWNYDYDICIQNHIHRLRTRGNICQHLYLYILMLYKWTDRINGKGIGLQGLSSGLLDKIMVPLPPYKEQLRIVAKIEELFALLDSIKESLEN